MIGVATNAPFQVVWPFYPGGVPFQSVTLTAVAVDNMGLTSTSAPARISITQTSTTQPTLRITAPTNAAIFAAPATFRFEADLLTSDGADNPVEFYANDQLVGTATDPPYGVTVSNLVEGKYELRVKTTGGNSGFPSVGTPISMTVGKTNSNPPTVTLVEPKAGIFHTPATLRIRVEEIDDYHRIDQVEFFDGTNSLGIVREPPYTMIWSNIVFPDNVAHEISATVADKFGPSLKTAANSVAFINGEWSPWQEVGLLGGTAWGVTQTVFGPSNVITFQVHSISTDNNLNPVEFYLDTNLLATVPQFRSSLTFTNWPAGQYSVSARVKDLEGRESPGRAAVFTVARVSLGRLELLANGQLAFHIGGVVPGVPFDIETSTNLTAWSVFSSVTPNRDRATYIFPQPSNDPQRYYRIRIGWPRPSFPVR